MFGIGHIYVQGEGETSGRSVSLRIGLCSMGLHQFEAFLRLGPEIHRPKAWYSDLARFFNRYEWTSKYPRMKFVAWKGGMGRLDMQIVASLGQNALR